MTPPTPLHRSTTTHSLTSEPVRRSRIYGYLFPARYSALHELGIHGDGNVVTHKDSAGLEGGVPRQTEILAIDLGGRGEPNPSVSPGILGRWCWTFHCKANFLGNAMNGQLAFDRQLSLAHDADLG